MTCRAVWVFHPSSPLFPCAAFLFASSLLRAPLFYLRWKSRNSAGVDAGEVQGDRQKRLELVEGLEDWHHFPCDVAPPLIVMDDEQVVQVDEIPQAGRFLAVAVDDRLLGPPLEELRCIRTCH